MLSGFCGYLQKDKADTGILRFNANNSLLNFIESNEKEK